MPSPSTSATTGEAALNGRGARYDVALLTATCRACLATSSAGGSRLRARSTGSDAHRRRRIGDRVAGLGLGADDYLAKPFAFAELVARAGSLGRRARPALPPVLEAPGFGGTCRVARLAGRASAGARAEGVRRARGADAGRGTAVSAEQLLEKAWDENADPFTNVVRVTVMTLRRKLGPPPVIGTVPGAGYRLGS